MKKRSIEQPIQNLALDRNRMVLISGPRQSGKTTLGKGLLKDKALYFNWDQIEFKKKWQGGSSLFAEFILKSKFPRILLDEFHKNLKWKNQIKGFFDSFGEQIQIIITGSAKLNSFRRGADSLIGRFIHFTLLPFSIGELSSSKPETFKNFLKFLDEPTQSKNKDSEIFTDRLMQFSGFPEPFEERDENFLQIWSKSRTTLLIREDLKDISNLLQIGQVEVLASYLPDRVGSPLSTQSLSEDLDSSHTNITRWLNALESVYFHFKVTPFSKSIPRSLKKEPKIYLYDWTAVTEEGPRFENLVAFHLKKLVMYYNETGQADLDLFYLRNKEKQEVDFLITQKRKPLFTMECKLSDLSLDKSFLKFQKYTKVPHFQTVSTENILRKIKTDYSTACVMSFSTFFSKLP